MVQQQATKQLNEIYENSNRTIRKQQQNNKNEYWEQ